MCKKIFTCLSAIKLIYIRLKTQSYYRLFFRKLGFRSYVTSFSMLVNPCYISIGNRTSIRGNARLEVIDSINPKPSLVIGDFVNIEQNVHIVCGNEIIIEDNVSITANCAIVDIFHPFDVHVGSKIGNNINCSKKVKIGKNSFIGFGSIILPGVVIGDGCVIGANSVVSKSIPDYCVATGTPAKVIKSYDFNSKKWINV